MDQYLDLLSANPDHKDIWKEDVANGIWQIIKLVIDDGVTGLEPIETYVEQMEKMMKEFK